MQSPVVHHTFAAETLRCLYHIFGYDFLFNELHFIHHLHSSQHSSHDSILVPTHPYTDSSTDSSNSILSPTPVPTTLPIAPPTPPPITPAITSTPRSKYSRAPPPDHLRCSALTARGSRCTFSIYANSLCSQHQT
jgi:hypothetical protein